MVGLLAAEAWTQEPRPAGTETDSARVAAADTARNLLQNGQESPPRPQNAGAADGSGIGSRIPANDCAVCGDLAGCFQFEPLWTVNAGTVLFHRSGARPATLVEDGVTDRELVNVSDFDLGFAAGPRLEVSRHLGPRWDLAVGYFGIDDWEASHSLVAPGRLRVPLVSDDPGDYFDTASASIPPASTARRFPSSDR